MKLEKRLRALEAKVNTNPTILHFADGSQKRICGPKHYLLDLLVAQDLCPKDAENLDLIRQCAWAEEPGGARLIEMFQSLDDSGDVAQN